MKREQRFLMTSEDLAELGRLIVASRPSVRFRADNSRIVVRSMPINERQVHLADAELAPGYDLPEPDLLLGKDGVGIHILGSRMFGNEMRTGVMSTDFNMEDPGHRAFVDAVFGGLRLATKPHVERLTGQPAPVRIGPGAERWWHESENRTFRDASVASIYYRVRTPKR